jgi:hypothetical protein
MLQYCETISKPILAKALFACQANSDKYNKRLPMIYGG